VTCVLTGAQTVDELRANVADFERPIPAELWDDLRREGLLPDNVPTP
jgi:D-threo-aldose 1-dehydrogenase